MFALRSAQKSSSDAETAPAANSYTPNILPCRIHHDGPVEILKRYWDPVADENENTQTAYFRGRKLRGRRVAIPEGYQGIVATPTDNLLRSSGSTRNGTQSIENGETESEPEEPVKILEKQATFDEYVVWGHEVVPAADDPFVRGVEEWLKFAETLHSTTPAPNGNGKEEAST
ncbi:hypothetical protein VTN02DRAFT_5476 [Thermoascus thermophilus]